MCMSLIWYDNTLIIIKDKCKHFLLSKILHNPEQLNKLYKLLFYMNPKLRTLMEAKKKPDKQFINNFRNNSKAT